ncbi:MAG: Wzz/FepE/Etk N-terminal domain-containing protein [Bacteroidaceae bacterium]|nr:Wzz/FepE/Etk N-terminal domain-containing protein [Bacteroidaceae bacterium]
MKEDDNSIDLVELLTLLWQHRRRIILNCIYGGIIAIVVAFSIPKEYTSTVVMAPELSNSSSLTGGIGGLAAMAGIDLNLSGSEDAIYPELYPQIIESTPFLCELMGMEVCGTFKKEKISVDLYHYLKDYQRSAWWTKILGMPGRLKSKKLINPSDTIVPSPKVESRKFTRRQQLLMNSLHKKIHVSVDKGTSVITLGVSMQDPNIAADVAQAVSDNLQTYIGNYRSAKARKDLESVERLFLEAQNSFYCAQQKYAEYCDQHQNVSKMKYQIEMDRLENEKNLDFEVYNQMASQLAMSKAKVQEQTPVCVVLQPAVVPIKASAPKKIMIGVLYVFLAFFGTCVWYLMKDHLSRQKSMI